MKTSNLPQIINREREFHAALYRDILGCNKRLICPQCKQKMDWISYGEEIECPFCTLWITRCFDSNSYAGHGRLIVKPGRFEFKPSSKIFNLGIFDDKKFYSWRREFGLLLFGIGFGVGALYYFILTWISLWSNF